jgi:MoxR-like ATPase
MGLDGVLLETVPSLYGAAQSGDAHGAMVAMRRLLARLREVDPGLAEKLKARLAGGTGASSLRGAAVPAAKPIPDPVRITAPMDPDSKAGLLRRIEGKHMAPVLDQPVREQLDGFLSEHRRQEDLKRAGLYPRWNLFMVGPPGVGKTMTAAWLAHEMALPLYQVELPSLVSSYLGRTGQNMREVFDFARAEPAVILLDEFDAIAKRRDDATDLAEMRRVVSVLLKEIEEWPGPSILVAATNHPELIDPAVFRRFHLTLQMGAPQRGQVERILRLHLDCLEPTPPVFEIACEMLIGTSGSDIRNVALESRRILALDSTIGADAALLKVLCSRAKLSAEVRRRFVRLAYPKLQRKGVSMAELAGWVGVAKSTIHLDLRDGKKDA